MQKSLFLNAVLFTGITCVVVGSCKNATMANEQNAPASNLQPSPNPVVYFEIPVTDTKRATAFYKAVFGFSFEEQVIDSNQMALFPFTDGGRGISGALAKGSIYKPTNDGVVIYFATADIDKTLAAVTAAGGKILYPKTANGDLGLVAEFEDSEGNRIALHQAK